MRKEHALAPGNTATLLAAGVLGCGDIALVGGITALAYTVAQLADNGAALPGALATTGTVLGFAGAPAGITALAVGVNMTQRMRVTRRPGYREATAGWISGAAGLVMYVAAGGLQFLSALYYYG